MPADLSFKAYGQQGGRAVVLLHGFPVDGAMWRFQVGALSGAGYRVVVPDLRGFGASADAQTHLPADEAPRGRPRNAPVSMDSLADDVARLLARLRIASAVVAGFSMGGYVALAFAQRHPDKLDGLVLVDTRAEPDTPEAKLKRQATRADVAANGTKGLVQAMLPGMFTPKTWAERRLLVDEVRSMMQRQGREGVMEALAALGERPDRRPMLGSIQAPVLILVGDQDNITPPASARAMADQIPGATLTVLADAAHMTPMERPDDVNAALLRFLDGLA